MTELHVHLDGSMRPVSVWEMAAAQGTALPVQNAEQLAEILQAPADCADLNEYLKCFDLPLTVLQEPESLIQAMKELVQDMSADGVTVGEIRFAPQLHTEEGYTQPEIVQAALEGLRQGKVLCPNFHGSLILCCMRGQDNRKANEETLRTASAFLGSGVCAADLAGAEALFPTCAFEDLFAMARRMDIPFTIHAGEAAGPESIRDALRLGARRIGHGVRAIEDPALCAELARQKIPLEVCVTSNLQTRAFPEGTVHPVKKLFDMGIHVTVNTDNRTVSHTTMTQERRLLADSFGFTDEELNIMEEYAREGRFLS